MNLLNIFLWSRDLPYPSLESKHSFILHVFTGYWALGGSKGTSAPPSSPSSRTALIGGFSFLFLTWDDVKLLDFVSDIYIYISLLACIPIEMYTSVYAIITKLYVWAASKNVSRYKHINHLQIYMMDTLILI